MSNPSYTSAMRCQAHVSDDKFSAWDSVAPWCENGAVTTICLGLITYERACEVWLCQEHYDEYMRHHEI